MEVLALLTVLIAALIYDSFVAISGKNKNQPANALFAKFPPGAIVSEIRGKIAATVFSRNRGGAVIRNRIKPINRRSVGQSTRRQVLGSLASSWRGVAQANRDS